MHPLSPDTAPPVPTLVSLATWLDRHTTQHPDLPTPIDVEVRAARYADPTVIVRVDNGDRPAVAASLTAWARSLDTVGKVTTWVSPSSHLHIEVHGSVLTESGVRPVKVWGVVPSVEGSTTERSSLATLHTWANGRSGVAA